MERVLTCSVVDMALTAKVVFPELVMFNSRIVATLITSAVT
jgi:hypothetical protein